MADKAYAFANEKTLDKVIRFVSKPIDFLSGSFGISQENILLAKITEVISDTEAKAIQVSRAKDGTTTDYPDGITWDTDADQSPKNVSENLITYEGFKFNQDQIVEVVNIPFDDGAKFVGFPPSAGSERPWIKITSGSGPVDYIGDVLVSPSDATVVASGVSIKAYNGGQIDAGSINSGREFFADKVGDDYYIQPSAFLGS